MAAQNMICPHCGSTGKPKTITPGSIFIEIILWCCFAIPGLVYSIWRLTARKKGCCPACSQPGMIPLDSPRGAALLAQANKA